MHFPIEPVARRRAMENRQATVTRGPVAPADHRWSRE
jgi:hypothetical protein